MRAVFAREESSAASSSARSRLLKRGVRLEYFSIGYNFIEAAGALLAALAAGSIALTGFGLDSLIEVTAAVALLWRFKRELGAGGETEEEEEQHQALERRALKIVGFTFVVLAAYIVAQAGYDIIGGREPAESRLGIAVAMVALAVMPLLAIMKQKVARQLGSRSFMSEAKETWLCGYLSLILLAGLVLNAAFGWSWADPLAALAMLPLVIREGLEAFEEAEDLKSAMEDGIACVGGRGADDEF